jgi:hypothetical protein
LTDRPTLAIPLTDLQTRNALTTHTETPLTCAAQARTIEEPLAGTAPEATGWLVIEQPGSWGRDAVLESGLESHVAAELARRADDLRVRIQIVRRPGHRRSVQRAAFLAHSGPERSWLRRLALGDVHTLLDLELELLLSADEPAIGEPEPGPLYLACTHAKRDQCCALWGRPLVDALTDRHPRQVWESSHLGGHRFAGNLLVLPQGYAYGYLEPDDGLRVAAAAESGEVDVTAMRGRSSLTPAAQAAEVFARQHTGVSTVDGVRIVEVVEGADLTSARVEAGDHALTVHVRYAPLGTELLTGCDKDTPKDPGAYRLVEIVDA